MLEVYPEIDKGMLIPACLPMRVFCQNWIVYIINAMTVGYVNYRIRYCMQTLDDLMKGKDFW